MDIVNIRRSMPTSKHWERFLLALETPDMVQSKLLAFNRLQFGLGLHRVLEDNVIIFIEALIVAGREQL